MVKNMTKRMFGFIALMMLMMATSLSAHAGVVTVKQSANGTVAVDKPNAAAGETVTITVTPNEGFYTTKDLIKAEKTIGGGSAQAPGLKVDGPGVGSPVTVSGDPTNTVDKVNTYTFVMPEDPYGVQVSAEFKACTVTYFIKWGEGDNWSTVNEIGMTKGTDGKWISTQATEMTATSQFKVYKSVSDGSTLLGEKWLGADATVTEPTQKITVGDGPNIHIGRPGTFSFSFDPETMELTVTSEFIYNVTVNEAQNGTVTANPTQAKAGETVALTIEPASGYEVDQITVKNGEENVAVENNQFTMPAGDVTVTVTFKAIDYTITVTQGENGTIAADKTTAHVGEVVTLTNTPKEDCVFVSYTVTDAEGNPVTVENNKFTMPASNVTVTATFRALEVTYKIKWGEGANWGENVNEIGMTKGADGKWSTDAGTAMTAANQFKVVKDVTNGDNVVETWYGASATVTEPTQVITVGDGPNIHIGRPGTFSFSFDPETMELTVTSEFIYNVTVNEAQNGTVTANPTQAKAGETVALTIEPASGYEVDQITVKNGEENVAVENNQFTMPAGDVTVTVTFKAIDYTITVTQGENGTIAADKTTAHVGEVVTLTNTPKEDCVFVSYTVTDAEGNPVTVENNKFTMPASNVTVTATFRALEVTYSIKWGEGDNWSTVNEIGMTKGTDGKWISTQATEMTATSQFKVYKYVHDGDTFISGHWLGKEYQVTELPATIESLAEETPNITLSKAGTYSFSYDPTTNTLVVTGEIEPEKYTITVAEGIEHGTVVPDKTEAAAGETVTLTVTPAEGYELETLTVMNGETAVEVTNNTFVMPAGDVTITATFKESIVNYNLTWSVTPAEGGTVEIKAGETVLITSPAQVAAGTHITITPSPAQGYEVESVKVNGTPLLTIDDDETGGEFGAPALKDFPGGISAGFGTYGFDMAKDAEVVVTFKKTEYTITVTEPQNGAVVPSVTTANMGDEITLTITPATGYEIDEVTVMAGEDEVELDSDYKFTMPASDVTVTVTFKAITYELEGVAFTAERNWATYYNGRDLALPQGMKAYVVDAINGDATEITEIPYIPAGVGVLLYSETAGENFTTVAYTGETDTYTTKLVGSNEAQEIAAGAGYVLYNNYFILSEGGTVAAHRCYLPVQTTMGAPRTLKIGQNGTVSAIETLIAEGNVAAVKYVNLSGMTSDQPFNGVNIAVVTFTDGTTRTIKLVK